MDANRALSQLSYRPKSTLFMQKKLRILDFSNIRFSWESPTNRTGKRGTENRVGCVSTMDANAALSQLSYEPKSALFIQKKLRILDFWNIRFSGGVQQIGQENGEQKIGSDMSHYGCEPNALPTELQAQLFPKLRGHEKSLGSRSSKAFLCPGGDKRDRTADLLNAIQALSQLSYTPVSGVPHQNSDYNSKAGGKCQEVFSEILQENERGRRSAKIGAQIAGKAPSEGPRRAFCGLNTGPKGPAISVRGPGGPSGGP